MNLRISTNILIYREWRLKSLLIPSCSLLDFPNAAQDAAGHLCCEGSLLAHVQLGVHQFFQILFCKAVFQPASLLTALVIPP